MNEGIAINIELFLALTPIVAGLVQVLKALRAPESWAPLLTLIVGIGCAAVWGEGPWRELTLTGVALGLASSGFYSGVTTTRTAIKQSNIRRRVRERVDNPTDGL